MLATLRINPKEIHMIRLPVLVTMILLLSAGCAATGNAANPAKPGANVPSQQTFDDSNVTLGLGQDAQLSDGSRLSYTSLIDDSRCPADVQCVWAGDAEIATDTRAPFLTEVANGLAGALSQDGHQLRVARVQPAELARRRSAGNFALMLDFVRNLSLGPSRDGLALVTAANPALADRPPKVSGVAAAQLARTLPLGIVGELRPSGYFVGPWRGFAAWDFGEMHLAEG